MLCKARKAFGVSVCQMMACESVDGVERGGSEVAGEAKHVSRQNFLGNLNNKPHHALACHAMLMMHHTRICFDNHIDKHVDPASYVFCSSPALES
jgi:hypothetical protein